MYIFASDRKSILDSRYIERFCLVEKPDAFLIIASYSADRAVTIGKYADREEAYSVLYSIYSSLDLDEQSFTMPDSRLFSEQSIKKDARTKRKGGS